MITFTINSIDVGSRNTSIGFPRESEFVIDTDLPIAELNDGQRIAVKPALWINPTQLIESAGSPPNQAYWDFMSDAGTTTGVGYPMSWIPSTNANNQLNYSLEIEFADNGGNLRITLTMKFQNLCDTLSYLNAPFDNKFKLLKDATSNGVILDNSNIDVYSTARGQRIGLWFIEPDDTKSFIRVEQPESLKFYGDYPEIWDQSSFTFDNCLGGSSINATPFNATFTATQGAGVNNPTDAYWLVIRTDTADNTILWHKNSEIDSKGFQECGGGATPYADWDLDNSDARIVSATTFANVGSVYSSVAAIDPTKLTIGGKYRFIFFIVDDDDTYSFISEELVYSECACFAAPTIVEKSLTDYLTTFDDNLGVAPQERIKACLSLDTTTYDAIGAGNFEDCLQRCVITTYSKDPINPNIFHYYDEITIARDTLGAFIVPAGDPSGVPPQISFSVSGVDVDICYEFRCRYQTTKNLKSVNDITKINLGQLNTNDWAGKTIYVNIQFIVGCGDSEYLLNYRYKLRVGDYAVIDPSLATPDSMNWSITDAETEEPLNEICYPKTIQLCSGAENSTSDSGGNKFILGMDLSPYRNETFVENDGDGCPAGELTELLNPNIIAQDCKYNDVTPDTACATIVIPDVRGKTIRFSATKKSFDPKTGCFPNCSYPDADLLTPEFTDFKSRWGVSAPNLVYEQKICWLIQMLILAGLWDKIDVLYILCTFNRNVAKMNLKGNFSNLTEVNWGVNNFFIADTGVFFTDALGYYNTNYNPRSFAGTYTQNDGHFMAMQAQLNNIMGAEDVNPNGYTDITYANFNSTNDYYLNNNGISSPYPNNLFATSKFSLQSRVNGSFQDTYRNWGNPGDNNYASVAFDVINQNHYIGGLNIAGVANVFGSPRDCYANSYGGGLTADEREIYYGILKCYHQSINPTHFSTM